MILYVKRFLSGYQYSGKVRTSESKKGKRTDLVREADEVTKSKTLSSVGISRQRANEVERFPDGYISSPVSFRTAFKESAYFSTIGKFKI